MTIEVDELHPALVIGEFAHLIRALEALPGELCHDHLLTLGE